MSTVAHTGEVSFGTLALRALAAGGVGAALCAVGIVIDPEQFFRSYLVAFQFWLALALGALGILLLNNLTGGRWGFVIRRLLEAATRTLPLLALLFVPLAFGLPHVYKWARPEAALDPHLQFKLQRYLNVQFFLVRAVIYFAVWLGIALLLNYWSGRQDREQNPRLAQRERDFSGPALVLHSLAVTFAAIDWVMSLDPHWFSSIFPAIIATGYLLPALALAIAAACWLSPRSPLKDVVNPDVWNDLGNLLLAFVMLWTYVAFSQFLLIWCGNLPEEITWYLDRSAGGWQWVAVVLAVFYFGLPFALLLSRDVKRHPERLRWLALAVACVSYVNQFWLVAPTFSPGQLSLRWLDLSTMLAVGGLWCATFFWQLGKRPLVPLYNPPAEEVLGHV